jgi:hypothetical protein
MTPWVGAFMQRKPAKAVRTRWLSAMICLAFLLPMQSLICTVIEKHFLQDSTGKIAKRWSQALFILRNPAHKVKWHILLVAHQEFFEEAMRLLQSNHGYNAAFMPDWVEAWDNKLEDLMLLGSNDVEVSADWHDSSVLFNGAVEAQTVITHGNRAQAEADVSEMAREFFSAIKCKLNDDLGFWRNNPTLKIATLLQIGSARDKARALISQQGSCPAGIPHNVWRDVTKLAWKGDLYRDHPDTAEWLELTFLALCVHNVDPERTFNVIGAFLKKAPNAQQFCISAHTRNSFNHTIIKAEFMLPVCAACKKDCRQRTRVADVDPAVLLCPPCAQTWSDRINVPTHYAINITMQQFCNAGGRPTTATRNGKYLKPGDWVAHLRYHEPRGSEKGGVDWLVGKVGSIHGGGAEAACDEYAEVAAGSEASLAAGTFEVGECVVITCRTIEANDKVVVNVQEIDKHANDLEQEHDRLRRKRVGSDQRKTRSSRKKD